MNEKGNLSGDSKKNQLSQFEVDASNRVMTTNDGIAINDNNNSLKVGERGPSLTEDFIFREKLAHFDRERIPERVVHARGTGAHGVFECYEDLSQYSCASFLSAKGKKTPLFLRFSTVAGFRGSTDLARDARGFSVKFYTDEGNFDLIGNNIPVFFIQDAMNFPDLIHAVKPEPHNEIPQAASAHDTFWDFVSLMPEAAHMVMWVMSDRGIPRSLRMMEGFGVHTFKLVNEAGKAHFVKFHWKPLLGVHSVAWNEAQKISGFNSDFHRQDLFDAIDGGDFPEWELGVQIIAEEDEHRFSFDLLDPTKLIPEELVPVKIIGKMTLNRNPENFFAETEQAAFHPGRVVRGIDFSNDPLLQGRLFSYSDTQIYRLGGANHQELPINRPVNPVHNNQRDGSMRTTIAKGETAYFPNSIGNGCPYQAMMKGEKAFVSHAEQVDGKKVRARSTSFADHFTQASLFYNSQTPEEQQHIVNAYSFELSKVNRIDIRKRYLGILSQINGDLTAKVAANLGLEVPKGLDALTVQFAKQNHPNYPVTPPKAEVLKSAALSMRADPEKATIATRKVAFLVADGVSKASIDLLKKALESQGAQACLISNKVGDLKFMEGGTENIQHSYLTEASVLYDAVYVPSGKQLGILADEPDFFQFLNEAYRHCKVIGFAKGTEKLIEETYFHNKKADKGLVLDHEKDFAQDFIQALKAHRIWERETARKVPS
ncbi:catalase [Flavobacterium sp. HSC-61S13]|uniref:catalase n=1 Tax=Flavobacterium sp. HSC-61S13 TaxID=2910963 RepID=UPI00209F3300|nr:catalase [Flavobacterium sp. HSC-61S13]MCP1996380.1 catalase [Flavobacterium sp. HSC-61S13]